MNKKTLMTLAGAALLCACQPTDHKGRIDLELAEMKSDTLLVVSYLVSDFSQENAKLDTILPGRPTYTYVAETDSDIYKVFIASPKEINKNIALALLPGEHIKLTGSIEDWQVAGSELNAAYASIQQACYPYVEKMDSLSKIMTQDLYRNEYLPTWRRMDSLKADYVRRHPDDDLSLLILENIRGKWVDELYPTLTERVNKGPLAPIAQVFEEGFRQQRLFEENRKKIVAGAVAPDFTLNNLEGQPLALSSLRGKYVVLDFWGSWCGWCIKGIPDMKKYYEKYKGKLEILGIDCRDTEEKWRAAVEKHELPWLHVRNEGGDNDVSVLYAVPGYPTKIVVDPEGKIAKVVVGEDPAFYKYLDELFK